MTIDELRSFFGWCTLINMGLLLWWSMMFILNRGFVYKLHTRWFKLSDERFDAIHYAAMAGFKLLIFVFNVVPWLALTILG